MEGQRLARRAVVPATVHQRSRSPEPEPVHNCMYKLLQIIIINVF